ncbi:unnamed protein product [Closterium sp. NIES-64]|nr:unnamed protein product [Closterium sp. NIES-64]
MCLDTFSMLLFLSPSEIPYLTSFGVLMLVVLTSRNPQTVEGEKDGHILHWVEECISSKKPASLKDPSMDAPDDAVEDCISSNHPARLKDLGMDAPDDAVLRVEDCISSNHPARLKDLGMDAPDDAVLRLAQLALSCTIERTASRPSMADIANELQGIGHEVVGEEELSAAVKVDEEAAEMGIGMSFRGNLNTDLEAIERMGEEESNGEQSAKSI